MIPSQPLTLEQSPSVYVHCRRKSISIAAGKSASSKTVPMVIPRKPTLSKFTGEEDTCVSVILSSTLKQCPISLARQVRFQDSTTLIISLALMQRAARHDAKDDFLKRSVDFQAIDQLV